MLSMHVRAPVSQPKLGYPEVHTHTNPGASLPIQHASIHVTLLVAGPCRARSSSKAGTGLGITAGAQQESQGATMRDRAATPVEAMAMFTAIRL